MPTVFVRDDLRASVEAATGGKCTVLYTATGQPCYMRVIPRFNLSDIDPSLGVGVHPAFVVNGMEKSELFIGMYAGIRKNGELLSLPSVDPTVSTDHDSFVETVRANGAGWHLVSNVEYAALALWCWKNGFMPRGNTNYGASSDAPFETGRRQDGLAPGTAEGSARTLTGSGPVSWNHDNTPAGIADLCGNVWEWAPGMRIVAGEVQVIPNNDAALSNIDLGPTSSAWKAIDGQTGAFITPTFTGSIAGEDYTPTTPRSVRYNVEGTNNYTLVRASGQSWEGMTNPGSTPVSEDALQVMRRYALAPLEDADMGGDAIWMNLEGERLAYRGGHWIDGARYGVFALALSYPRSYSSTSRGARPAFVL